jgi:molybdate transport system ATP-binding protein
VDEVLELASEVVLLANGAVVTQGSLGAVTGRLDLPPEAEALGLGTILDGVVEAHDRARGLSTIATPAGAFKVPLTGRDIGTRTALRVAARDVALALTRPEAISVQNILPVTVSEMRAVPPHAVRLSLRVGDADLLAEITDDARARLGLEPGVAAFALIKSVALAR